MTILVPYHKKQAGIFNSELEKFLWEQGQLLKPNVAWLETQPGEPGTLATLALFRDPYVGWDLDRQSGGTHTVHAIIYIPFKEARKPYRDRWEIWQLSHHATAWDLWSRLRVSP